MNAGGIVSPPLPLLLPSMESPSSAPLRALTAGLAAGDDEAWMRFHYDFGPGLFRQLLGLSQGDHALAAEALQETYLRIARHVRPCDSAAAFAAWCRKVARSALMDCFRRRNSFRRLLHRFFVESSASAPAPDEDTEDRMTAALTTALAGLSENDRSLLEAKYFHARDVRSLAAERGLTPKALESRLSRARAALRVRLVACLARHE